MTFYIAQSPVWLVLTEPSLLDLGGGLGAAAAGVAVATWVGTLAIAHVLDRTGVALTPGVDFDTRMGRRTVRLSFAGDSGELAEALRRLRPVMLG